METTLFLKMLERIGAFLKLRSARVDAEKAKINATIKAVNHAANHTRAYLADLKTEAGGRNRETEQSLSDKWVDVGSALREIDDDEARDLYERCFMKARYWSDPDGWDESIEEDLDIGLEKVLADIESTVDG